MKVTTDFPHDVREVEHLWVPMPDGARLAARAWLPTAADARPVPAVVEYIPYRKRDGTRQRDEAMHRWFAGHGYAALRVDLRGSGESDGLLLDEYLPQEQQDGLALLRWVAAQPWCSGRVGLIGKSWGGFAALQLAALRPPELGAVIAVCATDDRYADDAHYMGGCLLNENLTWGSVLFTLNALPPDPALVGPGWREVWRERLAAAPLFPETWLRHPRRDAYWRHGSVGEDPGAIACPVYAVSGWADGYTNAVARLLARLRAPRKGLVGPWAHIYPHEGVPGPAIGFLQEALRWWDQWLLGRDTGVMDEPAYRVWMQEGAPPRPLHARREGRWVAEEAWPSPRIAPRRLWLNARGLDPEPGPEVARRVRSPSSVGLAAGAWCGFGLEGEAPLDQREDDGRSCTADGAPLAERLEILGAPRVALELSADRPVAQVAVRLCDVRPDGVSERVSYGLLNLTHRDGHAAPAPLEPGRRYRVELTLNDCAHAFAPGHRLRVAVSSAYWPVAWPAPQPVTLTLFLGACWLELPVRPPDPRDAALPPFAPPEAAPADPATDLTPTLERRTVSRDLATGETVYAMTVDTDAEGGPALTHMPPLGAAFGHAMTQELRIREDDPTSARAEVRHEAVTRRDDGSSTEVRTRLRLSSTASAFRLEAELVAREGETEVARRTWDVSLPRDLV